MSRPQESPAWIVYERQPNWAPLLRRDLTGEEKLLVTGSLDQCWEELDQRPGSAVLLQLTDQNWGRVVPAVSHAREQDSEALFLAAVAELSRPLRIRSWQVGFVYMLVTPLDVPGAVRLVRRHLQRLTRPVRSFQDQVWHNLPWSQY